MRRLHGKQTNFILPFDLLNKIDRIAKKTGKTRAQTARDLMYFGIDVYTDFEKVGLVKLADVTKRASSAIREKVGQQNLFDNL